ncbi:MAG: AAA family ATPase [Bryobacteraceae bacterium]
MIVSFSVSNFRSFSSEETLSLVASNRLPGCHDDHTVPTPDSTEKVLRAAVLYGANGAGKSNLFKALRYMRSVVLEPRKKKKGTRREPFRLGGSQDEPSSFDLQFIAAGKLYRFGFKVDDRRIIEEWLFQVVDGRQNSLYERTTDANGRVAVDAEGLKGAGEKVIALATVGGPQNRSFLATVNVTLDEGDFGKELGDVLTWFRRGLILVSPDESIGATGHLLDQDSGFLSFAGAFLKSTSTGVDHLEVDKREISIDEISGLQLDPALYGRLRDWAEGDSARLSLPDGTELLVEGKGENRIYQISIQAAHEQTPGKVVRLDLAEESDGTRRLLNLIPALHHLRTAGAVYFIDEIDRSLHPILVKEFLEFFLKSRDLGQLIVTTHESNLLDQDLLRRDEIWFVEKDPTEATSLYSLLDFKIRDDPDIRKHYLQGRFGAVPFLGNLENLLPKTDQPK